jgi:hypothetical protein
MTMENHIRNHLIRGPRSKYPVTNSNRKYIKHYVSGVGSFLVVKLTVQPKATLLGPIGKPALNHWARRFREALPLGSN